MNIREKIRITTYSIIILTLFLATYFLSAFHASLIFHLSIIAAFCIFFYQQKKLILLVPIITSLFFVYLITAFHSLGSPWWYVFFIFPISILILIVHHIVSIVKLHKDKQPIKIQIYYLVTALSFIGIGILHNISISYWDVIPTTSLMMYKEPTFMFTMFVGFGCIYITKLIGLMKND